VSLRVDTGILRPDPPIDEPAVVADLVAPVLNGLDDVRIFITRNLAQHDVPNFQLRRIDRSDRAQLSGLDAPGHGLTVRAE
jgi:hypothetical protein